MNSHFVFVQKVNTGTDRPRAKQHNNHNNSDNNNHNQHEKSAHEMESKIK